MTQTREQLEATVWEKFQRCVRRWYATNPYYRTLLHDAGVEPDDIRTRADLRRIPLSSKADLIRDQEAAPPFGHRLGVDDHEVVRVTMTGGTTGKGRTVQAHTAGDRKRADALMAASLRWRGHQDGDILVFNVPISNHIGGWLLLGGGAVAGRVPYLTAHEGFAGRIELMKAFGVNAMHAPPSALNGLTRTCHELGAAPCELFPDLRMIVLGGEAYPVAFAERMQDEWGAAIHECYGSTESGAESFGTCEAGAVVDGRRGLMHFYEDEYLSEVIDPVTGDHVREGESGRLVFTTLYKQASPLLRYDSGDVVTWMPHRACGCGRPYDGVEAGTIGRFDDMLKIKGVNIWPAQIDEILFSFPGVNEYQGEVVIGEQGRDEAIIRLAFTDAERDAATRVEEMSRRLRAELEVRFDILTVPAESLPVFANSDKKARRWTDRRHEGLASA